MILHVVGAVVGLAIVLVALVDMLWTTVAASAGGGPLTSHVSKRLWDGVRWLSRRGEEIRHGPLRVVSIVIVAAVFSVWLSLAWLGWTLVFLGSPDAVVSATTAQPASVTERAYFAGYSMATLGNGEFVPNGALWQGLTVVTTLTGFGMATMAITYLVPVVGAVTDRRSKALHITSLGSNPAELVVQSWGEDGWSPLEHQLQQIGPDLALLGQRHLAYPILHYFHDVDVDAAAAVRIAMLDEALTLLEHGVAPEVRPRRSVLSSARRSVNAYLGALRAAYIRPADEDPPAPSLRALREAGIPTVSDDEFHEALQELSERRRTLCGALHDDGWTWAEVSGDRGDGGDEHREGIDVDDFQEDGEPQDDDAEISSEEAVSG